MSIVSTSDATVIYKLRGQWVSAAVIRAARAKDGLAVAWKANPYTSTMLARLGLQVNASGDGVIYISDTREGEAA